MCEQGFVDEATRDKDWINYTTLLLSGEEPPSELLRCIDAIADVHERAHKGRAVPPRHGARAAHRARRDASRTS